MMETRIRWGLLALSAAALALVLPRLNPVYAGGNLLNRNAVGGILVKPNGLVERATEKEKTEIIARMKRDTRRASPEMNLPVELRKVSLRGLEAALADALANNNEDLPEEIRFLGGLQRIQYILVYPELQDIVLAGPGEGWKVDDDGQVVGVTTGRPVLRFDDLLIALRTALRARNEGISVSIDPTAEGLRKYQQFMQQQRTFNPAVIKNIAQVMGPQKITFSGIPTNSHFARVLLAADYRMKRIAMRLDENPTPVLPSYLDMLRAARRQPSSAVPRWWMACDYQPLARSDDKLAWEIRGPGVKVMTEDEVIAADGTTQGTGRADLVAKKWADTLTDKYEAVSQQDPALAELQTLMDMAVVAAIIKKEDLPRLAGDASFPNLMDPNSEFQTEEWFSPQTISTQISHLQIGRNHVITASGGVQLESWEVAENQEVDPEVKTIHTEAAPANVSSWWWN
jgi:hypothetical protein